MSSQDTGREKILQLVQNRSPEQRGRMVLVVSDSALSMTATRLRELVPTFGVSSMSELVGALDVHARGQWASTNGGEEQDTHLLVGLDISRIPSEETVLLVDNLALAGVPGTVYVMTPEQFSLFNPSFFDFVVR